MEKIIRRMALIGAGAVGTSFMYSAINQGIAQEYFIIDLNEQVAKGHQMDFEDVVSVVPNAYNIVATTDYSVLKDVDVLVITAGRPQKSGETRLEMVKDNAKIMKSIAISVKNSGFKGITLIASNPVDVMTTIFQYITKYSPEKVISSSCSLDTSRLRWELSRVLKVSPKIIKAFVLGEHGDSSVSTFEYGTIDGIPFKKYLSDLKIGDKELEEIHEKVYKKAYKIIKCKGATYYGIGASLAEIVRSIFQNEKKLFAVGALLNGEYGESGVYAGVPCVVGVNGIEKTLEFPLSDKELQKFKKSIKVLRESFIVAKEVL